MGPTGAKPALKLTLPAGSPPQIRPRLLARVPNPHRSTPPALELLLQHPGIEWQF
jgi:hypothetical protein